MGARRPSVTLHRRRRRQPVRVTVIDQQGTRRLWEYDGRAHRWNLRELVCWEARRTRQEAGL